MREYFERYFKAHWDEIMSDLRRLIAFESLEERPEETEAALSFIIGRAAELGMRTGYAAKRDSGWAEIGDTGPTVGVLAHVDVVGLGDISKWLSPPFELTERDGALFGRGAIDDKGPAVISLWAIKALSDSGMELKKRVRLIIGTSEESEWTDMRAYKEQFGEPDLGFSPDGEFPVYNIEKGYADYVLTFAGDWRSRLEELSAGDSPNTVPSRATLREKGGEPRVFEGRAVHSSAPEQGDNAITKLCAAFAGQGYPFADFVTEFFLGDYSGLRLGLDDGADTENGVYVGRTTSAPTILRLTADGAELNVNIRHRYGTKKEALDAAFAAQAEKYGYTFRARDFTTPVLVSPDQPFLRRMNEVYASFGLEGGFKVAAGASYAQTMNNCVAWGPAFPGDPDMAHKENECVPISSLLRAGLIYGVYLAAECAAD